MVKDNLGPDVPSPQSSLVVLRYVFRISKKCPFSQLNLGGGVSQLSLLIPAVKCKAQATVKDHAVQQTLWSGVPN